MIISRKTGRTVLLAFCSGLLFFAAPAAFAKPLAVTVSIPPQKFFVEKIGGDEVAVTVMTGKGRDPHSYEPTAAQMEAMARAELYIAIGVPFETQWLPKFRNLNPLLRVVSLPDNVPRLQGKPDLALRGKGSGYSDRSHEGHGHRHGLETDDPHIWLSPKVMAAAIPAIAAALSEARPEKAALFAERAAVLAREVETLDAEITSLFAPLPEQKKLFLTFHQSWAYFAHNYTLREVSVELEGREPSPRDMAKLMEFAAKNGISVIVADPMTSKSMVAAIAGSINGTAVTANPLDENWPGALRDFSRNLARALAE